MIYCKMITTLYHERLELASVMRPAFIETHQHGGEHHSHSLSQNIFMTFRVIFMWFWHLLYFRSTGVFESPMEYYVPRSMSEFNLSCGDLALPAPPRRIQQTIVPIVALNQNNSLMSMKPREKMVTFEDESVQIQKCPHGVATTPLRKSNVATDIFM
jgi:hypothetical protein